MASNQALQVVEKLLELQKKNPDCNETVNLIQAISYLAQLRLDVDEALVTLSERLAKLRI